MQNKSDLLSVGAEFKIPAIGSPLHEEMSAQWIVAYSTHQISLTT
jgi:hypothetical protein